jgi:hypothetical protein
MFEALDASIDIVVRWRDEGVDRLLDSAHASLVEIVVRLLESAGWLIAVEASFNVRGERGSIDILAWHPSRRIVLIVEVKTIITDLQAMLRTLDRKVRLAPVIAREREWEPTSVGRLLVVAEGRTARRRIAEHSATLGGTFPSRGRGARAWLRAPTADTFGGLILLPVEPTKRVGRRRIRRANEALVASSAPSAPSPAEEFEPPMAPWTERTELPDRPAGGKPRTPRPSADAPRPSADRQLPPR